MYSKYTQQTDVKGSGEQWQRRRIGTAERETRCIANSPHRFPGDNEPLPILPVRREEDPSHR